MFVNTRYIAGDQSSSQERIESCLRNVNIFILCYVMSRHVMTELIPFSFPNKMRMTIRLLGIFLWKKSVTTQERIYACTVLFQQNTGK